MSKKEPIEIQLNFRFAGGNSIPLDDVIFGRTEFEDGTHKHEKERIFNQGVSISGKGGFIREGKFAIQDRYVIIKFFELSNNNVEIVAEFLAENLPKVQKDELSLEIDKKNIRFTKEEIKKALEEFLKEHGYKPE